MTLEKLQAMLADKTFHHATYRNRGTLWEGLWIYRKENCSRKFGPVGAFLKDSADLEAAHNLVRHTGVSVGSFGQG